jgi:hypothetical protein
MCGDAHFLWEDLLSQLRTSTCIERGRFRNSLYVCNWGTLSGLAPLVPTYSFRE